MRKKQEPVPQLLPKPEPIIVNSLIAGRILMNIAIRVVEKRKKQAEESSKISR